MVATQAAQPTPSGLDTHHCVDACLVRVVHTARPHTRRPALCTTIHDHRDFYKGRKGCCGRRLAPTAAELHASKDVQLPEEHRVSDIALWDVWQVAAAAHGVANALSGLQRGAPTSPEGESSSGQHDHGR